MKPPASILRTLTLGLGASVVGVLVLLGVVALLLSQRTLREGVQARLEEDAFVVLAALQRDPQGGFFINPSLLLPAYQLPLSGRYFVVEIAGQTLRSRSLWDEELPRMMTQDGVQTAAGSALGQHLLLLRSDFRRHGSAVGVTVAADMAPDLAHLRRNAALLLGLAVAASLLLLALQRWWLHRALQPLARAHSEVLELQRGTRELLSLAVPQELQALIGELNRLLRHAREAMTRSRHALGNLGHALKSPLGVLFVLVERAEPALQAAMRVELQRMQRRIGRELARARSAGEAVSGQRFDPWQQMPLLLEAVQRARQRELVLHWDAPEGTLPFEQDDMLELLGNLLDNACKWARQRVELRLLLQESCLVLRVEDDGPGIPEQHRTHILQRGVRLDESVEGHGLGFGIVGDMVALYHGHMDLGSSTLGGLLVEIRLPLPQRLAIDSSAAAL